MHAIFIWPTLYGARLRLLLVPMVQQEQLFPEGNVFVTKREQFYLIMSSFKELLSLQPLEDIVRCKEYDKDSQ